MLLFSSATPHVASLGFSAALRNSGWIYAIYKRIQLWNRERLRLRRQNRLQTEFLQGTTAQVGLLNLFEENFTRRSDAFNKEMGTFVQEMDQLFADSKKSFQNQLSLALTSLDGADHSVKSLYSDLPSKRKALLELTQSLFSTKLDLHQAKLERSLSLDLTNSLRSSFETQQLALSSHESSLANLGSDIEAVGASAKDEGDKLDAILHKMNRLSRRLSTTSAPSKTAVFSTSMPALPQPLSVTA